MSGWQTIETAPKGSERGGKLGVSWMLLACPDGDGGHHCVTGMRVGDEFFAALTYYCGGAFNGKQFEQRETAVNPTHWMPLPAPPEALA